MLKIFLSSHGQLASGFQHAAKVLLGEVGNLTVFDAYLDERSVEQAAEAFFEGVSEEDTVVLLADIIGGSVCNALVPYSLRPRTTLIGGVNLALLLELLVMDEVTPTDIEEIVAIGKNGVAQVFIDATTPAKDDSEEFF